MLKIRLVRSAEHLVICHPYANRTWTHTAIPIEKPHVHLTKNTVIVDLLSLHLLPTLGHRALPAGDPVQVLPNIILEWKGLDLLEFLEPGFLELEFLELEFLVLEFLDLECLDLEYLDQEFLELEFLELEFPVLELLVSFLVNTLHVHSTNRPALFDALDVATEYHVHLEGRLVKVLEHPYQANQAIQATQAIQVNVVGHLDQTRSRNHHAHLIN